MTIKLRRRRRDFDENQESLLMFTPESPDGFVPPERETSDSKSFNRKQFWKLASERCSPMELEVLAARAAGEEWSVIAEAHNISERHATRLASQAAGRITGVRLPFRVKGQKRLHHAQVTYAIQAETGGPIKIGKTMQGTVAKRVSELNVGHPEKLILLALVDRTEAEAHEELEDHRLRGEWFDDHPEVRSFIDIYRMESPYD